MKHDKIFLAVTGLIFAALLVLFLCFPRSTYSEVERRELSEFPEFSIERLKDGSFTADVSRWFSDTEPFRDQFMEAHHSFRRGLALNTGGETITFHDAPGSPAASKAAGPAGMPADSPLDETGDAAEENARIASAGIIVTGEPGNVRALMCFGAGATGTSSFAQALNYVSSEIPGVRVYAMVIPLAIEFYCPEQVKNRTKDQAANIRNIYSQLNGNIRAVDAYSALRQHTSEPIYLRTDHHWAPLGAYYAGAQLARTAGVPYRGLDQYDRGVTRGFVGTMYGYSQDISVKQSPEDFVYYIPKDKGYTTWFTDYIVDRSFHVTGQRPTVKGRFFTPHKDGSGAAYTTMLGSDMRTARVETGMPGNRKVLIIKDSYGNALPGFLFGSFSEVHVIDFRYFPHSLRKYIADNGITDLVYCVNVYNANSSGVSQKLRRMVGGAGYSSSKAETPDHSEKPSDTGSERKKENPHPSEEKHPSESTPVQPEPAPAPSEPSSSADPLPE